MGDVSLKHKMHGKCHTRLYRIWCCIKGRCLNKNNTAYKNYGGRGIKICDEWKQDFMKFYDWAINNGYNDNLTIDRINVNGDYEPINCKWTTMKEQTNNKRDNHYIKYKGRKMTISELSELLNIHQSTLWHRIKNNQQIDKPVRKEDLCKKVCQYDKNNNFIKEYSSISEASRITGIGHENISICCNKREGRKSAGGYIWKFKEEK